MTANARAGPVDSTRSVKPIRASDSEDLVQNYCQHWQSLGIYVFKREAIGPPWPPSGHYSRNHESVLSLESREGHCSRRT